MLGDGGHVAVDGEAEWAANGGDTTDNVSSVDGGRVPCICSNVDSFNSDLGVTAALVGCDSDGFVKETKKAFNGDRLMIVAEARLAWEIEGGAHSSEMTLKRGASVRSDEEAEPDAEENVLHEEGGEGGGIECVKFGDDGKTSEVAHGAEDVLGAVVGGDGAWLPNVGVDDSERGGYWPGVDEFAVVADGSVGCNAVGAGFDPRFDVCTHFVPEEAQADAM